VKRFSAIEFYVAGMAIAAVLSATVVSWSELGALPGRDLIGLASLIGIGVLSEALAVSLAVPKSASSITFLPFMTAVVLFGPAAGVVLLLTAGLIGERVIRRKESIRVVFNISQWVLASSIAGALFWQSAASTIGSIGTAVLPFLWFTIVFLALNQIAVSVAITLSQGIPLRHAWRSLVGKGGGNPTFDLLVAPVALLIAFLYRELWLGGLALSMLPLLFIRAAYLTTRRLEDANRNLLSALVKAIETRDPYTSGHSLRVARLAKLIAVEMDLGRRTEAIETAALLHDVGKIDPVYVEILRKPESLTAEERAIIESHVTKGVELLKDMTSFSDDIILAVRHHHERVDGRGYPDRLIGKQIPLGARIIKVCDAIDAMLSDRPYRRALSTDKVKEQLSLYSGSQFDPDVVRIVLGSKVLETYIAVEESTGGIRRAAKIAHLPDFIGTRQLRPASGSTP
jgi:putative nucleotidyltransferase with HDIG domain